MQTRTYRAYKQYLTHQRSKLGLMSQLSAYDAGFRSALRERLQAHRLVTPGMRVLCLGARLGTEVKAFLDLGCFAIGVDLNPGRENPCVLYGDFHDITFPAESADVVFTNSFDHVLNAERVIAETHRVLKPQGLFMIEAVRGREEGQHPGFYESFFWLRIDDLVIFVERHSFRLIVRDAFSIPWVGEHLCFTKAI